MQARCADQPGYSPTLGVSSRSASQSILAWYVMVVLSMHRETLAVRASALEEMLEETRAERGQLENYKQLARETEAAKARFCPPHVIHTSLGQCQRPGQRPELASPCIPHLVVVWAARWGTMPDLARLAVAR